MSVSIARLAGAAVTALTVAVAGAQQQPATPASGAMKDTAKMASKSAGKKRTHRARTGAASKARHDSSAAAGTSTPKPR